MNWKCKHCNEKFNFERTTEKANHTRWCKNNPNAKKFRDENSHRGKIIGNRSADKKYGRKMEFVVNCGNCSKEFNVVERKNTFPSKERYFCNQECASAYSANSFWDTIKSGQRTLKDDWGFKNKEHYEAAMKHRKKNHIRKCKITNKLIYEHICYECGKTFESASKLHKFCSGECKRKNHREGKENLQTYRSDSSFKFNLKDFPDEFDFHLIETYGWYSPTNRGDNLQGVSRDHMVSVRWGYDNNISPNIIEHPANCKLMQHSKNISKNSKCSIEIEELIERIKKWDAKYAKSKAL